MQNALKPAVHFANGGGDVKVGEGRIFLSGQRRRSRRRVRKAGDDAMEVASRRSGGRRMRWWWWGVCSRGPFVSSPFCRIIPSLNRVQGIIRNEALKKITTNDFQRRLRRRVVDERLLLLLAVIRLRAIGNIFRHPIVRRPLQQSEVSFMASPIAECFGG